MKAPPCDGRVDLDARGDLGRVLISVATSLFHRVRNYAQVRRYVDQLCGLCKYLHGPAFNSANWKS
jgi:hypothetical protein